jgi:hypothetical protein
MCKKLAKLMLVVVLLCSTACFADGMTVWLYGNQELFQDDTAESVGARIGFYLDSKSEGGEAPPKLEVGIASEYYFNDEKADLPQSWSIYGVRHFPDLITIPQPIPFEYLPEEIVVSPYVGAQVGIDFDADGVIAGPIAGIRINEISFIEYQYAYYSGELADTFSDEHRVLFGLRFDLP